VHFLLKIDLDHNEGHVIFLLLNLKMSVGRPGKIENEEKEQIWYYKKKDIPYLDATSTSYMTKILRHAKEILLNKLQVESGGRVSIIEKRSKGINERLKR